jgi:hypothetical protein
MSNAPQAETTTTVEQIMNVEGNEDVCMCVCDKERRGEKKREKKTRKEDFGGVYTVRESHVNIFLITFFSNTFCQFKHALSINENIGKKIIRTIFFSYFSFLFYVSINEIRKHNTNKKNTE